MVGASCAVVACGPRRSPEYRVASHSMSCQAGASGLYLKHLLQLSCGDLVRDSPPTLSFSVLGLSLWVCGSPHKA